MADHHHDHHEYTAPTVDVAAGLARLKRLAGIAAVGGLAAWAALGAAQLATYPAGEHGGVRDLFLTYQTGFVFWMSLPIGAMALLSIAFMTSASWGLVLRRCFQAAASTWPVLFLLFLPIAGSLFAGEESPFWWVVEAKDIWTSDAANPAPGKEVASAAFIHEQEHRQHMFLNPVAFLAGVGLIFALYFVMSNRLVTWSRKSEDDGDAAALGMLRGWSGAFVLFWALTWSVLVTAVVMSVEVSWASTMFPVVSGMNCFLTAFAFCTVVFYALIGQNQPVLSIIKDKFRIDIGSLTFGFTMVWCYATFCQYMLIWAGNLPEEIGYVQKRTSGGWEFMALLLALVHWFLPFIILLFREVKTDPVKMSRVNLMLLFICAVDVTWWLVPAYPHAHQWLHVPMAAAAIVGVGGVWSWFFFTQLGKANLLPKKDTAFLATWGHH